VVQWAEDPGCQVGGAAAVRELEQGMRVVSPVASNGGGEPGWEAGVAKAIDPPGEDRLGVLRQVLASAAHLHSA
jgi:hypothetical protein